MKGELRKAKRQKGKQKENKRTVRVYDFKRKNVHTKIEAIKEKK